MVAVPVDWSDVPSAPVVHVNQTLAQIGTPSQDRMPDGVYLSLGSAEPPVITGSTEERQRALEALSGLKVTIHGRFHMSRSHLADLIKVLETVADQYDTVVKAAGHGQEAAE
jgi:hypothetical protein